MRDFLQMKILIVDDDPISVKLLQNILVKDGYENIQTCVSGEEALELVKNESPDVVLLDILMPGIKGYEVCKRVRDSEATAHIPILMVTGGAADADAAIKRSFKSGATDFITKPLRPIEFLARVRSALTIKQKHDLMKEEINKRKQADKEKEKVIAKLMQVLAKVKTLSGMLPICANCKKIRDDKGYWSQIEAYIRDHSEAEFSHSICPECAKKLYPDLDNI